MVQEQLDSSVTDPLAAALLPVLVHRMNNTTQLLSNLHAILGADSRRDWLAERAEDLGASSQDVHELGYLIAVLSSASGADLLQARRLSEGLEIVLKALAEVARRQGCRLPIESPIPRQAPDVHAGWELPWAVGALLHQSLSELQEGQSLDWQLLAEDESWVLISSQKPVDGFEALRPLIAERLPESVLDVRDGGWSWRIPAGWLRDESPGGSPGGSPGESPGESTEECSTERHSNSSRG